MLPTFFDEGIDLGRNRAWAGGAHDEPDKPRKPTAEDGINQKPAGERPSGQNTPATQQGTKNADSGPATAPANTETEAEANPAEIAAETPFRGAIQPDEPGAGESDGDSGGGQEPPAHLSDEDKASYRTLQEAKGNARNGDLDDIKQNLSPREFKKFENAFEEKLYWIVKMFFGKYMEKAIANDPDVLRDPNITRLGTPFKSEPDFQVGKFNIDITTDSQWSEDAHLGRDYIDSTDNLMTYRRLGIPEMFKLFGEG